MPIRGLCSPHAGPAAIDTVGGRLLATLIRQTRPGGCVAACGVAGGADLPLTVYPFILRGVTLAGIDAAWCPMSQRRQIWSQLAGSWRLKGLEEMATTVRLADLDPFIDRMLQGHGASRVVVQMGAD